MHYTIAVHSIVAEGAAVAERPGALVSEQEVVGLQPLDLGEQQEMQL